MDPDATWRKILDGLAGLPTDEATPDAPDCPFCRDEVGEALEDLGEWIRNGGAAPEVRRAES